MNDFQRTLKGSSVANRRRGFKAAATRRANQREVSLVLAELGAALRDFDAWEKETYGGTVRRTVLRSPAGPIEPQEISEFEARRECSVYAIVTKTTGTDFEGYEGCQFRALLTIDGLFMYPSAVAAFGEILDAGCELQTQRAVYRMVRREVE